MSKTLRDPGSVRDELRRLLAGQYERAHGALKVHNVHRLRTSCKWARAILKLIDDSGGARSDELNGRTKAVADAVGGARDDQVLVKTISRLAAHISGADSPVILRALSLRPEAPRADYDAEALGAELRALRDCAQEHDVPDRPPWGGLGAQYRRARRRMPGATEADADAFHVWRKHVKRHYYQVRLLKPLWPREMRAWADELEDLGDWLGAHHDLAMAVERLHADVPWSTELIAEAHRRQGKLAKRSLRAGSRAFAARPGELVDWLEPLWLAWARSV